MNLVLTKEKQFSGSLTFEINFALTVPSTLKLIKKSVKIKPQVT